MPEKKRKTLISRKQLADFWIMAKHLLYLAVIRIVGLLSSAADYLHRKSGSWWRLVLAVVCALVFLYYPIGGWMIHNIDTSNACQPQETTNRLESMEVMSCLINREVHHKIWTPNLPFLFPSYFLKFNGIITGINFKNHRRLRMVLLEFLLSVHHSAVKLFSNRLSKYTV